MTISCLLFIAIAGSTIGKSPFSVSQLLIIYMISGVCAAVSLATEAPNTSIIKSERVKENFRIVTPYMIREIATQIMY